MKLKKNSHQNQKMLFKPSTLNVMWGQPVFKCSANSNEVSEVFVIPSTEYKVPVNFRVAPE